ncbi:MAG: sigma-54-dependent Fis family transcriptional regulator [Deltaproteobacteria bacterium]|nr:sigma-54-dependent Fis family transcriptional regulator [Deltaproteobacteria bacterium]
MSRPVLVVDEKPESRKTLFEALTRVNHAVDLAENGEEALEKFQAHSFDLVIADINIPRLDGLELLRRIKQISSQTPVIVTTDSPTVDNAVEAMREGAFDFILKPYSTDLIEETVNRALGPAPGLSIASHRNGGHSLDCGRPIITQDPKMHELLKMGKSVAHSKATVLVQGVSGTGKELLARFIHQASNRNKGPFVAINCASLPEGLLESELFGHEKGSFTGASVRKIGKFELAHQGTILLDEISEMALALQAKLLRVLQEGEIDRVGGKKPISINVRVIATTNRELKTRIEEGLFRQDLYYRLNVIPLRIPALNDRRGDIPLLIEHFLEKFSRENGRKAKRLSANTFNHLLGMDWPGNVRELENIIARGILLSEGEIIELKDLFLDESLPASAETVYDSRIRPGQTMTIREMERELIQQALVETDGNRTHAAKILGISVRTLRNKLTEYKNANWGAGQAA